MNSEQFNRDAYNSIATAYQAKRKDPAQSTWNDFLELPAIESLRISRVI